MIDLVNYLQSFTIKQDVLKLLTRSDVTLAVDGLMCIPTAVAYSLAPLLENGKNCLIPVIWVGLTRPHFDDKRCIRRPRESRQVFYISLLMSPSAAVEWPCTPQPRRQGQPRMVIVPLLGYPLVKRRCLGCSVIEELFEMLLPLAYSSG